MDEILNKTDLKSEFVSKANTFVEQADTAIKGQKQHKDIALNNNVKKNWRLVQLLTSLENFQGSLSITKPLSGLCYNIENKPSSPNVRNTVMYKNVYITNPLVQNDKMLKVLDPNSLYESLNVSLVGLRMPNLKQNLERKLIDSKDKSVDTNSKLVKEFRIFNTRTKIERFFIKANFVAHWLSESIVSSKTYKVSLLCDRVIKSANINSTKVVKTKDSNFLLTLVGIKIVISGRILGAEIATSKTFKAGQIPNNTLTVLKDRGFALAKTRSGTIGIKVTYFWKINKDNKY